MELRDLMEMQLHFDQSHSGRFDWSAQISDENLEILEFLAICIIGEIGELANIVKKVVRGDFKLDLGRPEIEEEIADIFIYLVKICNQMDVDLESIFLRKLETNKNKFTRYEL